MLNAGELRHQITIQKRVDSRDATTGAITFEWQDVCQNIPARVTALSVKEFMASAAMQSQIVARIKIRYREGLDAKMRIIHKGQIYNPAGWLPDPDSGEEYLTAPCSLGVNEG